MSAAKAGDLGLIPGSGRSPGEGNGNPLQYSCLENTMDGGAWWATVHGVGKSWTRLSDLTLTCLYTHTHTHTRAHTHRNSVDDLLRKITHQLLPGWRRLPCKKGNNHVCDSDSGKKALGTYCKFELSIYAELFINLSN